MVEQDRLSLLAFVSVDHHGATRQFVRPVDATELVGEATKAKHDLGWQSTVDLAGLVEAIADHDPALLTASEN